MDLSYREEESFENYGKDYSSTQNLDQLIPYYPHGDSFLFSNSIEGPMATPQDELKYPGFPLENNSNTSLSDLEKESLSYTDLTPLKMESLNNVPFYSSDFDQPTHNLSMENLVMDSQEQTWRNSDFPYDTDKFHPQDNSLSDLPFHDVLSPKDQYHMYFEEQSRGDITPVNSEIELGQSAWASSPSDFSLHNPASTTLPHMTLFDHKIRYWNIQKSEVPDNLLSDYTNNNSPLFAEDDEAEMSPVSSPESCSSLTEYFSQTPMSGEMSWVREIKVGKNNRPRGPKCWEFLLRLLYDTNSNPRLVKWEDPYNGTFRLVDKDEISKIWGNRPSKKKKGKTIKYESFARILRYHYKKGSGKVVPVPEKHLVYKFPNHVMQKYRAGKIS